MRNTVSTLFCSALVLGLSVSAPMAQQVGSNTGSIGTLSGVPTPSESARSQVPGHGVGTLGPQSQIPGLIQQNAQPIAFRDPKRGFVIAAPTGAKFDRREESGQVLIHRARVMD